MELGQAGEVGDHVMTADPVVGGAAQQVAGMVIQPAQDLGVGAIGQGPVGEIGLPALVGLVGLEPAQAAVGTLSGFRGDQAGVGEDPADCRGRGWSRVSFECEPVADAGRAVVQPGCAEFGA